MAVTLRSSRTQLSTSTAATWTSSTVALPSLTTVGDGALLAVSKRRDAGTITLNDPDNRFALVSSNADGNVYIAAELTTTTTVTFSMSGFPAASQNGITIAVASWANRAHPAPLAIYETTLDPAVVPAITTGNRAGVAIAAVGHPHQRPGGGVTTWVQPLGYTQRQFLDWLTGDSVTELSAFVGLADTADPRPDAAQTSWVDEGGVPFTFHYGMTFVLVGLDERPTGAPPCRLFPREDGLGVGGGRIYPPPKSQQRSGRRFGYY